MMNSEVSTLTAYKFEGTLDGHSNQELDQLSEDEATTQLSKNYLPQCAAGILEDVNPDLYQDDETTEESYMLASLDCGPTDKVASEKNVQASIANPDENLQAEPTEQTNAKEYAEGIIQHCKYLNEAKDRPLKIVKNIWLLEEAGGFTAVDCKDAKDFYEKNLTSLISKTTFYRYCAAAEFARKNLIEVTNDTIKALYAIADVHEKSRDEIWEKSKSTDNLQIPKSKRIRELEAKRKAKGSKDNVTVNSADNIEPVEKAENTKPSLAVQTIFSKFNGHETLVLQNLEAAITQRLHEFESDQFGIQPLTIPELTSLSELVNLTMQSRKQELIQ